MIVSNDNEDDATLADRLYAARTAYAETKPAQGRPALAELVRVLAEPARALTPDLQRALFADARLRVDFKRLRAGLGAVELPALAAASAGDVAQRAFEGGTVRIHPSRRPGQVYVIIEMARPGAGEGAIILESASGEVLKRPLPAGDPQGRIMLVLDEAQTADQDVLRLMRDPMTTGALLI